MIESTRRRITVLVANLSSSGTGRWDGVRAFQIARGLQRLGHHVEIVGFTFDGGSGAAAIHDIPLKKIPASRYPEFCLAARDVIQSISGDLIYAMKLRPASFGIGLIAKLFMKVPLLLDIDDFEISWLPHVLDVPEPSWKQVFHAFPPWGRGLRQPEHEFYLAGLEHCTRWADGITSPNRYLLRRFGGSYLPSVKDTDLFDPAKYDPDECRHNMGFSSCQLLMFPGAPRPYKGVEDILQALDLIDRSDLKLVIVGGSLYDTYDESLRSRWPHRLVYLPVHSQNQMPAIVAASHVVVVPNRNTLTTKAQFPLKILDGMAMAKPVLATRVGDIPEVLADTGLLVEPESPDQLAEGIVKILSNGGLSCVLGSRARQRCIELFSMSVMERTLSEIIRTLP